MLLDPAAALADLISGSQRMPAQLLQGGDRRMGGAEFNLHTYLTGKLSEGKWERMNLYLGVSKSRYENHSDIIYGFSFFIQGHSLVSWRFIDGSFRALCRH